jgi:hypothetical protein
MSQTKGVSRALDPAAERVCLERLGTRLSSSFSEGLS